MMEGRCKRYCSCFALEKKAAHTLVRDEVENQCQTLQSSLTTPRIVRSGVGETSSLTFNGAIS